MNELTKEQRKKLKSLAHHIKPLIQLGHKGITETFIQAVAQALDDHELIKVKFQDHKEQKQELSYRISSLTESVLVTLIGNTAVFFKSNPDDIKRKISI